MKNFFLNIILILLATTTSNAQAGFEWAQAFGQPFYGETNTRLAADSDGSIVMAGGFIDTAYFGGNMLISNGGTDIVLARYSSSGELLWITSEGGPDYERVQDVEVNEQGIMICATFYGTSEIGTETFTSLGSQDIILGAYDQDGNFSWAKHIGSPKTDNVSAICSDPDGNIFITGHYYDSISFGDTSLYALAGSDIYIAKYNPVGNLMWLQQASGSSSDQSYSIACDEEGNIVFSGSYFNDVTIGDTTLTTENPTGVFMAKLDNDGDLIFALQADGNNLIAKSFTVFDNNGNFFFTGNFTEQINFGPYSFDAGAFNIDVFISKYSADGHLLWADHGYGLSSDQLISASAGPLNDLYISGHYLDTIHFGDLTLDYTLCCGSAEIFIVRYNEDGTASWGDQITGERALAEDMVKNADDELFVAGLFQLELNFGDIIIEAESGFENFLSGVATGTMTSLPEESRKQEINIYPNPADNYIFVNAKADYKIYDISGRLQLSGRAYNGMVDVSALTSGIYILKIEGGDRFSTAKFYKK